MEEIEEHLRVFFGHLLGIILAFFEMICDFRPFSHRFYPLDQLLFVLNFPLKAHHIATLATVPDLPVVLRIVVQTSMTFCVTRPRCLPLRVE